MKWKSFSKWHKYMHYQILVLDANLNKHENAWEQRIDWICKSRRNDFMISYVYIWCEAFARKHAALPTLLLLAHIPIYQEGVTDRTRTPHAHIKSFVWPEHIWSIRSDIRNACGRLVRVSERNIQGAQSAAIIYITPRKHTRVNSQNAWRNAESKNEKKISVRRSSQNIHPSP